MDERKIARNMRKACRDLCAKTVSGIVERIIAHGFILRSKNRSNHQQVFGHRTLVEISLLLDPCTHKVRGRYLPLISISRHCHGISLEMDRIEFVCVNGSDPQVCIDDADDFLVAFMNHVAQTQPREVRRVA